MKIRKVKIKDANDKLDIINELSKRVNNPNSRVEYRFDFIRNLSPEDLNYRNINVQATNRVINFLNQKNNDSSKSLHINFLNNLQGALKSGDLISDDNSVGQFYRESNKQDMLHYNSDYDMTTYADGDKNSVWFDSNGEEITNFEDINDKGAYAKITRQYIYTWFNPEKTLELDDETIINEMNSQLKSTHNEKDDKLLVNWDLLKKNITDTNSKFASIFAQTKNQVFIKKLNIFILVSTYYTQQDKSLAPEEIKEYEYINDENYENLLTLKGDKIAYLKSNKNMPTAASNVSVPTKIEAKAFTIYDGEVFSSDIVEKEKALDLVDNSIHGAGMAEDEFYTGIVDAIKDVINQINNYVKDNKESLTEKKIKEITDTVRQNYHYLFSDVKDRSKELFETALPNSFNSEEGKSKGEKAKSTKSANKNVEYDMKANKAIVNTSLVKKLLNDYKNYLIKSIESNPIKTLNSNKEKILNTVNELDKLDTDEIIEALRLTDDFADDLKIKVDLVYNKHTDTYDFVKSEEAEQNKGKYSKLKNAIKEYMER